jgi:hypothetical protein
MKTRIALLVMALATLSAWGQGAQGSQIKQRAKETVNQNNVRQGVPPPSSQSPPRPAAPAPANPSAPGPTVSQTQSIANLKGDLVQFKTGGTATAAQKQQFIKNLALAARGTKPSLPTVTAFVDALTAGLAEATLTSEQQGRLAQNLEAVLNSKRLPASQFDAIIEDVQAILQVGSMKRATAINIAKGLKAVGLEVRR